MKKHLLLLILQLACLPTSFHAHNLRQINSKNGLSNSSVTCLFQDDKRFLWIGTFDGLNKYNSYEISTYKPSINNPHSLSSNIITDIVEADSSYLWVNTKWGLNKLSLRTCQVEETYHEFGENSHIAKDSRGNLYVAGKPGTLSLYSSKDKRFIGLPTHPSMVHDDISSLLVDSHDTIYILNRKILERYTVSFDGSEKPLLTRHKDLPHKHPIRYAAYSDKKLVIVDDEGDVSLANADSTCFIANILPFLRQNGKIGSIIFDDHDLLIGFKTNGLIRLNASKGYQAEKINIDCGVFALHKDKQQDIIWIGTDGQGVYAWTKEQYTYGNITLDQLPLSPKRPIRAIYTDRQNTLWMGTKENGIIRIKDYDNTTRFSNSHIEHLTTSNGLVDNAVFTFVPNRSSSILWIGTDGPGLNYYSCQDNRIHTLENPTGIRIAGVHSLLEYGDSLLWVGAGSSLLKIDLQTQGNRITARQIRPFRFHIPDIVQYNQIYALCAESDSVLWIGMRGNGAIRFNTLTGEYRLIDCKQHGIIPMNDILCIHRDKHGDMWLGTSYGLTRIRIQPDGKILHKNYHENEGLPNNTIHGIVEDHQGNLWLSSNNGIIVFNPGMGTFHWLNHRNGLKTIEFCDNAYYWDKQNNRCFFGGVDGLVWGEKNQFRPTCFLPGIHFTGLRIFNQPQNLSDFTQHKKGEPVVVLEHDQNTFAVSFVAVDFVNGENNKYAYMLENFDDMWMDTRSHEIQFTNIPPGNYVLKVKYGEDDENNGQQVIRSLRITVRAPWYRSRIAYAVYCLLLAGGVFILLRYIQWKYERRKEKIVQQLDAKYKEEAYENKLRFFTNITHEFCTPLTLICGPCERILGYEHSDPFVRKYASIIKSNSERLNSLIQEIIDFRRIETGNQTCHICQLDLGELAHDIIGSFGELAEQNEIRLQTEIAPHLLWNSDRDCFYKILSNLISNAFKYTPRKGTIRISAASNGQTLTLRVFNTGKGISPESIPLVFNRYTILDNVKENSIKSMSSRNGLGLAICQSMVKLLQGEIRIESQVNKYAEFIVELPMREADAPADADGSEKGSSTGLLLPEPVPAAGTAQGSPAAEKAKTQAVPKATLLVIDDNKDLLWMLKEVLSDQFHVITAESAEQGLDLVKRHAPDLIVTDVMMPDTDGLALTRRLKENKHTLHIPLVILSAKNSTEARIEGMQCGADAYVAKPFKAHYLKAVIAQLLKRQQKMKEYYHSAASSFEFSDGQLMQAEDKEFLQAAMSAIDQHIGDPAFGPDELASALQTSSRNLYRRFKLLNQPSPKDFIKKQRIGHAARLLLTTQLTIQEIMYRTAFLNRSHFYKEFAKHYQMTPKEYRENNRQPYGTATL